MSTFDHGWYWTPRSGCRQGTEMGGAAILAEALWLTPEGERRTKALERTEEFPTDSKQHQVEKPEGTDYSHHQFPHAFSGIFACGSGWPLAMEVGLWIKLILFIITFDLIWYQINNMISIIKSMIFFIDYTYWYLLKIRLILIYQAVFWLKK